MACTKDTVTLLRYLQYGSKFGLQPLFAYQDRTCGRVFVLLYWGNIVILGPLSLERYQIHRVQRFNIQGRICHYVDYSLQYSSAHMRQFVMSLATTRRITDLTIYASTALNSGRSYRQQTYFSVFCLTIFFQHLLNVGEFRHHHTENREDVFPIVFSVLSCPWKTLSSTIP